MKIAIVINTSWNIYNFRLGMIKEFLNDGHEVVAIAPKDDYSQKLIDEGCTYMDLPMQNKGVNPLKDFSLFLRMRNIYKKSDADIFLQYTIKPNIYGTMAASSIGKPVINNVSGLGTIFIRENLISKIGKTLYRFSFKYAQKVFFQNRDDLQLFISSKIIKLNQATIIPGSGIDLQKFVPSYNESRNLRFVMASRLIKDKGIYEYVEAAQIIKKKFTEVQFTLCGFIEEESGLGVSLKEIENWQLDGIINYVGSTDDIRKVYKSHDVVILPSYREGTPKSLLEAAAMAKPIITTNVPGCKEVVKQGINGFLCKMKDGDSLANAIEKIISLQPEERKLMGGRGRELMEEKFDQKIVIDQYKKTIKEVLNGTH